MATPFISIITATYNAGLCLERLIKSIIPQKTQGIEFIIIDGDSIDGTLSIIKQYQEYVDHFISEPDNGIYDAWNKGIKVATGEWIMFLGADDQLVVDAIKNYRQFIQMATETVDFISSRVQMIDKDGKLIRIKGWIFEWPLFLKEMTVAHPGALHSKRLFQRYGNFDTTYKIVGDYEFLLRPGISLKARYMDKVTVLMSEEGVSDSPAAIMEHYRATTTTGKYPKHKALVNIIIVNVKFRLKKLARKLGLNLYLRKAK
jgi:glycosyltransferase involved in cell wall biosynthesis